jgi:hypothetical protein
MAQHLTCPKCWETAFKFLFGCEAEGPCYMNQGRFDAEAFARGNAAMKNSPEFLKLVDATWDKVFKQ